MNKADFPYVTDYNDYNDEEEPKDDTEVAQTSEVENEAEKVEIKLISQTHHPQKLDRQGRSTGLLLRLAIGLCLTATELAATPSCSSLSATGGGPFVCGTFWLLDAWGRKPVCGLDDSGRGLPRPPTHSRRGKDGISRSPESSSSCCLRYDLHLHCRTVPNGNQV